MESRGTETYAVILAGGSGTRFWPKSRKHYPKQLCAIGSAKETMIAKTLTRLDGFIPPERRIIVTHRDQVELTREQVGNRCAEILAEPQARNTAAALALAALQIEAKSAAGGQALMVSLHADHIIEDLAGFQASIKAAETVAQQGWLTLLGVVARYPETGYGYIERGEPLAGSSEAYKVRSFREKPERAVAQRYVEAQSFYWNSGLFVWEVGTLLGELEHYMPATKEPLAALLRECGGDFTRADPAALAATYGRLPNVAIDHGVLEVSAKVAVVPARFDWQDVGSWDALEQCFATDAAGNLAYGDTLLLDCQGTTVDSDGPFVAALGLSDMVVVAAKGAVLVCPKERSQEVKKIVERLSSDGRQELL